MSGTGGTGLRVLAFCDHFGGATGGGAEAVAASVFEHLARSSFTVLVIGGVVRGSETARSSGVATRMLRGHDLSRVAGGQFMVVPGLRRTARRVFAEFEPDVIHASSIHFHSSRVAARLARRTGIPLVTTAHVGPIDHLPIPQRWGAAGYERTFGRSILRSSTRVIAVSQTVADHVSRLGARKVTVIPNGVDASRFAAAGREGGPTREILFVGRLIANKGPDVALEAFLGLNRPDARLTFVGDGPLRRSLETRVRRARAAERVRFSGHLADVAPAVSNADIMVRPSQTEGQSLAILEAMAAGVCVVASDIAANQELLEHGVTGLLVPPGDVAGLTAALEDLLDDPVRRSELARNGREAAQQHSWERCASATGRVLAKAAAR